MGRITPTAQIDKGSAGMTKQINPYWCENNCSNNIGIDANGAIHCRIEAVDSRGCVNAWINKYQQYHIKGRGCASHSDFPQTNSQSNDSNYKARINAAIVDSALEKLQKQIENHFDDIYRYNESMDHPSGSSLMQEVCYGKFKDQLQMLRLEMGLELKKKKQKQS
jgi:hypothetical protein